METEIYLAHNPVRLSITARLCVKLSLVLLGGLSPWAGNAAELSEPEVQAAIAHILEMRHPTDTPEWWRALGSVAPRVIEKRLAQSSRVYERLRLIEALGHFTDPVGLSARVDLLKSIASQTPDNVLRHAAIRSVAAATRGGEVGWISQFLENPDPQTQSEAVQTLQRIGTPEALEIIKNYQKSHPGSWIVKKLDGPSARNLSPMRPSGSSQDRLSPDWEGEWKGFWIEPGKSTPARLVLRLHPSDPQKIVGEVTLGAKQSRVRVEFSQIRDREALGQWMEILPKASNLAVELAAHLTQEGRRWVLRAQVSARAASLVLYR